MKRMLPALVLLLAVALGVRAGQPGPRSFDRLDAARWTPLSDGQSGRLYDAVGELLSAARALPPAIDLPVRPAPDEPPPPEPRGDEEPEAPPQPVAAPPPGERWLTATERPVVPPEDLAHAHFLAGQCRQAAALYRALREERPDDRHLLLMLALCERNAGNAEGASALLAELEQAEDAAREWAEWLRAMSALNEEPTEEQG